jgi:carboxyvinyl-carboxyphosphonate phosphorylmutase
VAPAARVSECRARLRAILAGDRAVAMASVFDPLSARIADALGCEAGLMGGSAVAQVLLAAPDITLLTLTELAEQVARCARVSAVPIVVDADHGYGNALNAMRTVDELDRAGAAALQIEDTVLPRPFGAGAAATLHPLDESVAKVRAACEARGDSDLLVFGRTGAAALGDVEGAIARCRAFEAAGVDALFLPGADDAAVLARIAAATTKPIVVGGVKPALADPTLLASHRVRLHSLGHQAPAAALQALWSTMEALHRGVAPADLPGLPAKALVDRLLGAADWSARGDRHLTSPR